MKHGNISTVLIARGAFADMYEPAWNRSLNEIGIETEIFDSHGLTLPGILGRVERRILFGPGIKRIQNELVNRVKRERPDVTLLYQGHYFNRETIERIRPFTFVAGYHNDDPFGPKKGMLRYRLLLPGLPLYHGYHVYRSGNREEALAHGVPRAEVLKPYYIPWLDYPRELSLDEENHWGTDLVFAGHVENDLRVECLYRAIRAGIRTKIYGEDRFWRPALLPDTYREVGPIRKVIGDDYRRAICGSKIAASFLSKWNRDEYTRRSFEIPACKVFMLSERTPALQELYEEGKEAEFFSSPEEFVDKLKYYLSNAEVRNKIALAGYQRVQSSGHDVYSRMRQWLSDINRWREETVGD